MPQGIRGSLGESIVKLFKMGVPAREGFLVGQIEQIALKSFVSG
jgi:hypothetical protein